MLRNSENDVPAPKGAAILDYGQEFGGCSVGRLMRNDGPNMRENDLPNKVTEYTRVGQSPIKDAIQIMGGDPTPGYSGTKSYGENDGTNDIN